MINVISGRKVSRKGQIEGDTKEDRASNWFKHFQGNPPDNGGQDEEIDQIIEELIKKEKISMMDHLRRKNTTKQSVRSQRVKHAEKTISPGNTEEM